MDDGTWLGCPKTRSYRVVPASVQVDVAMASTVTGTCLTSRMAHRKGVTAPVLKGNPMENPLVVFRLSLPFEET